jgi:integrase
MPRRRQNFVVLPSSIPVTYSIVRRHPDPYLFIRFRAPDGRRLEKTTKVTTIKSVEEVALSIIAPEYGATLGPTSILDWNEAISKARVSMAASGLRDGSIGDYLDTVVAVIRRFRPSSVGPADFSDKTARDFKLWMAEQKRGDGSPRYSPNTVCGYLNKLSVLWTRWFIEELRFELVDPWQEVKPPKMDKENMRVLSEEEEKAFFGWIKMSYGEVRIAYLYALVKLLVGSRSMDLASLQTHWLVDGRICFPPDAVKGREAREAILPAWLFKELKAIAGTTYAFEKFPEQLAAYYLRKGGRMKRYAHAVKKFEPKRLNGWLQDACKVYNNLQAEKNPAWEPFTLHHLRGTGMSRYLQASDGDFQGASIAFDCGVETIKAHYAKFNRTKIADKVLGTLQTRYQEEE